MNAVISRHIKGPEDFGNISYMLDWMHPEGGRLTVLFEGLAWTNYWGHAGINIMRFVSKGHDENLVKKLLGGRNVTEMDESEEALTTSYKKLILQCRRLGSLTKDMARELWAQNPVDDYGRLDIGVYSRVCSDWHESLPQKKTHDAQLLDIAVPLIKQDIAVGALAVWAADFFKECRE